MVKRCSIYNVFNFIKDFTLIELIEAGCIISVMGKITPDINIEDNPNIVI